MAAVAVVCWTHMLMWSNWGPTVGTVLPLGWKVLTNLTMAGPLSAFDAHYKLLGPCVVTENRYCTG